LDYSARILRQEDWRQWDVFVASHSLGNIHQTSQWGGFQASRGAEWKFWVIGAFLGEKLVGGALILRRRLPFGRCWLYIPKGPLIDYTEAAGQAQLNLLLTELKALGRREKAVFLRVEPGLVEKGPAGFGLHSAFDWRKEGFRPAHAHYQPENTLIVDLKETEQQILAQMKPKGRYNIKVAEKKGVKVLLAGREISEKEAVSEFHRLLVETTSRDGFAGHAPEYYLEMLEKLGKKQVKLYLAKLDDKIIAGIIVTFYGDLAIYYFGASSNQYRNVMAPYLLQWEAMRTAKQSGQSWYDFLGTAPLEEAAAERAEGGAGEFSYDRKHAWAGVTEFKLKFGGKKVAFYPGREQIYQPLFYWLIRLRKMMPF
jgi:lipid II:glycine glycyltransferase (peptidoglycan interpeptide bridge formation enzyme)